MAMAGDWLKMRSNLWDDPRVAHVVDLTDSTEGPVIGALYWLWATADQHTEDGFMPGLTLKQIDRKTALPGFGAALCTVGWLLDGPDGVTILRFEEHNGTSAKRRCVEAQRKANGRKASASDADNVRTEDGQDEDEKRQVAELEKEKSREEIKRTSSSSAMPTVPCPYDQIVDAYHDRLPSLPRAKLMSPSRQKALRGFWAWVLSSHKTDGTRRATTPAEALQWIGDYFARAASNDFLMGRTERSGAHANWRCDLDFLLGEKGRKQVIERTEDAA